ncbi:MAG: C13 family peptidase [Cellvibrionaceae bacterium]
MSAVDDVQSWRTWPVVRILPLLRFRSPPWDALQARGNLLTINVALLTLVAIGVDRVLTEQAELFSVWGINSVFLELFFLAAFYYFVAVTGKSSLPLTFLFSITVEIWLLCNVLALTVWYLLSLLFGTVLEPVIFVVAATILQVTLLSIVLYRALDGNLLTLKGYMFSYAAIVVFPIVFLGSFSGQFWYPDYAQEYNDTQAAVGDYDTLLLGQPAMVADAVSRLQDGEPGRAELYYLGFGSYATESVFENEINYMDALLSKEFGGAGHGLTLINSMNTVESTPLAIGHNIQSALKGLSGKMNVEEDILFFYLTTHGSRSHELAVRFYPLELADITPENLGAYLKDSGIRWRIVVVSACYAGGFIDSLKSEDTIVFTAAAADKRSFGCGDGRDFTYFGEALFKDNLTADRPILESFRVAIERVSLREQGENLTPSDPQLWVGGNIAAYLEELEQ